MNVILELQKTDTKLFSSEFSEHPSKSPLIKGRLSGDV